MDVVRDERVGVDEVVVKIEVGEVGVAVEVEEDFFVVGLRARDEAHEADCAREFAGWVGVFVVVVLVQQ